MKSTSIKGPQVGDIVRVKPEHVEEVGQHVGLVTRLIEWPEHDTFLTSCVVFLDPDLANPVQFKTRYVEVISRA